jgi:protein-S-isoprenylcysteine O-methyltransferase
LVWDPNGPALPRRNRAVSERILPLRLLAVSRRPDSPLVLNRILGRYFTVDVSISAEHKLIDSGPYRHIRHPTYTGALLAFLGLGLCFGNWLSILFLTLPIIAAFLWRIRIEERVLLHGLGQNYRAYVERTSRLIPFVY